MTPKTKKLPVKVKPEKKIPKVKEEPVETLEEMKAAPFRYGGERCEPSFTELKNMIGDTLDRLDFFSDMDEEKYVRENCEYWGEIIARAMIRGTSDDGTSRFSSNQTRFVEETYDDPPYCDNHKEEAA